MKVFIVLLYDTQNDGEYRGVTELIAVFSSKEKAEKFIKQNENNKEMRELNYGVNEMGELFIQINEVE